jgi:SAM-dependent methyltransferase
MRIEWPQGVSEASCPICGAAGEKAEVLSAEHVLPQSPPITLLRCGACGAAFLEDQTTPDYEAGMPEMLDYYVEQGAGIDLIVAPLLRLPPSSVRRALEIGCSFGYALDFSRHALGWEVLGVDPSPLAVRGAAELGIRVLHTYFDSELDVGPDPYDLVLCSEILEHVARPQALLAAIRERLSPDGLLVLSTPNVGIVRKETEEGMLARALSPGLHLILYDGSSLSRVLSDAGFTEVLIEESPETLRVFAALGPAALERLRRPDPASEHAVLRRYLDTRADDFATSSVLASGLAYRHFKECVNAGLYDEAIGSRARLARIYRDRYGLDFDEPYAIASALPRPFNLTGALFFAGILELNWLGRPDRAALYFSAAAEAAMAVRQNASLFITFDGETEALFRQSLKHLPMALAATDPERALRELERLDSLEPALFPAALLDDARNQTFVRLVNAGEYPAAERLAPFIAARIATGNEASLDPLFCLAMLALQLGRAGEAAELFRRVSEAAERRDPGDSNEMLRLARLHEVMSLERALQS